MIDALSFESFFLDCLIKATILLVVAIFVALCCRKASASTRHLLWLSTFCCLLVLPCFTLVLPQWHVPVESPWAQALEKPEEGCTPLAPVPVELFARIGEGKPLPAAAPPVDDKQPGPMATANATASEQTDASFALPALPGLLWGLGSAAMAMPLLIGFVSLSRLRRSSVVLSEGAIRELLDSLIAEMGLRRPVTLLRSHSRSMPMTWGLFRPVLLLPASASEWPRAQLRSVLVHELAHIRRWDCLTQCLALAARALYWFHPLVWVALRCLRAEQERACDDCVLLSGTEAADYAEHLLVVTTSSSPSFFSSVALAMSRASRLERRLIAMLDPQRNRRPLRRIGMLALLLGTMALLFPIAAIGFQAKAETPNGRSATADETEAPTVSAVKQLVKIQELIRKRSVKGLSEKNLIQGAIKGIMAELNDPYSAYISEDELRHMNRELKGQFFGIGVQIRMEDDKLMVETPLENSPSAKAGLKPGDVIKAIDGKPTGGQTLSQLVLRIIGEEGTKVKLTLARNGKVREVSVTRARIKIPTVAGFQRKKNNEWDYVLNDKLGIAYVKIRSVNATTVADVRRILTKLPEGSLKGLVLDLRDCPGGLLQGAVQLCDLFLSKGTILSIKGLDKKQTIEAEEKGTLKPFPLVVLVNERTASAGEIVAGGLGDNERAVVVGNRTFGKGSVQSLVQLKDLGGALKLTTAHYYLPSGRNIAKGPNGKDWGVDPGDGYYVPLTGEEHAAWKESVKKRNVVNGNWKPLEDLTADAISEKLADPQLAAAVKTLSARLSNGKFIKVGKGRDALKRDAGKRADLEAKRKKLLEELQKIEKELKQ